MSELDFYEIVRVLDTPATRELGVPNVSGVVVGKAKDGSKNSYAVLIGDETYALHDPDVEGTGKKIDRVELYSGETIRVSVDGEILDC